MNKENNKSAAGLRRSAIAERMRLREEWSALKGSDDVQPIANVRDKRKNVLRNAMDNVRADNRKNIVTGSKFRQKTQMDNPRFARAMAATTEVLRGVVALVEVGAESRALPLRAALAALGATVVPAFNPLVTHLVWSQGGCRETRARARALACQLVSPLWVEACAAGGKRLPEIAFPAAARPSDLPSPRTLRRLLYKAEMENIPLADLLSDGKEKEAETETKPRLRISSETERDTSTATDTSANTSADTSRDRSHEKTDIESRVNTAPRRALPAPSPAPLPAKSRRKLFTQKEQDLSKSSPNESDEDRTPARPKLLTQRQRRDLGHAERMAKRMLNAGTRTQKQTQKHANAPIDARGYRIVLTGMSRSERVAAYHAIRTLNGRIQKEVNRKTTHVLLGSCREDSPEKGREINQNQTNASINNTNKVTNEKSTVNISIENKSSHITNVEDTLETLTSRLTVRSPAEKRKLSMTSTPKKNTTNENLIQILDIKKSNSSLMATASLAGSSNMAALESSVSRINVKSPSEKRKLSLTSTPKKNTTNENLIQISVIKKSNSSLTNMATASLAGTSNMEALESSVSRINVRSPSEKRKLNLTLTPKKNTTNENLIEISGVSLVQKTNMAAASLAGKSNVVAEVTAVKRRMASPKERTLNALLGAARGCRVLFGDWAMACAEEGRWIHHCGYEVPHLRKLSQRARIERNALGKTRSEYAYDVFNGMRVRVLRDAEQRDAAVQLLKLCGAIIVHDDQDGRQGNGGKIQHENRTQNKCGIEECDAKDHGDKRHEEKENYMTQHIRHCGTQNGGWTQNQNGRFCQTNCVIVIGVEDGQVNSKWVFDSVASARVRTVRRYVNKSVLETSTFCE